MDIHWTQELLDWLRANPGWGFATMFVIAFVESLALVGFLIPGIVILFGFGVLVGFGALEMWPLWVAGSAGAMLGDGLSYWLGYRYREQLTSIWPFSRYPGLIEQGRQFFRKHGGKGIVAGRFIGPLRPFVPVAVGIMRFPPRRYFAFNIPAAVVWTPFYLLPGMIFGASLEVVSEYAGRLALVMMAGVAVLWLTWWLISEGYAFLARRSARWLRRAIQWSRRHPVMGRLTASLLDPNQPEVLSVSMLGLLLVLVMAGIIALLFLSPFSAQPQALDAWVHQQAMALRSEAADPWLVGIAQIARWGTLVPAAAAALFWLLGAERRKAALHWLAAILGGVALQVILGWALRSVPVFEPDAIRSPSAAMTLTTVVTWFFAVLVARELPRRRRKWPYLIAALVVSALGFARIYLGLDWLSGVLMGAFLGLGWTAIVGIAYRQHALRPFNSTGLAGAFYGVFALALGWQVLVHQPTELEALRLPLPSETMASEEWWDEGWRQVPRYRTTLSSVSTRAFNLQSVVSREVMIERLAVQGWEAPPMATGLWVLKAFNPEPDADTLPLLHKGYLGRTEALLLRRASADGTRQQTLRIWDSGVRIGADEDILYLGLLAEEQLHRRLMLLHHWHADVAEPELLQQLVEELDVDFRQVDEGLLLLRPQ